MAQTRLIQRRIRSVKNAKQITKALEVVAASRMRRVVAAVAGSRQYAAIANEIMLRLAASPDSKHNPFFVSGKDGPTLFVVFSSDRGQAGAFNSNIFHLAKQQFDAEKHKPQVVVYGRKGARFFAHHLGGIELKGVYEDIEDTPDVNIFAPLLTMIQTGVTQGTLSRVCIVYTQFVSSIEQKATALQLFPINTANSVSEAPASTKVYEVEPDIDSVLGESVRLYIESRLMQAKIESAASEHAMRMVAMSNANNNASDLIDSLTLEFNATRQAVITQEIAEITGGAAAIAS